MAVIVKETRILGGKEFPGVVVYKSERFVTETIKEDAKKLDQFLNKKIKEIRQKLKNMNLVIGNSEDTLQLRYEMGKMLSFVDDPAIGESVKVMVRKPNL